MKQNKEARLPQIRVSQDLYNKVKAIAQAQEMSIADVMRAALDHYAATEQATIRVPIIGKIVDDKIIFFPGCQKEAA